MENYHIAVKDELLSGKRISVLSVLLSIGSTECRKIISDLKKDGLPIASERVISTKGKPHKEYWVVKEEVAA